MMQHINLGNLKPRETSSGKEEEDDSTPEPQIMPNEDPGSPKKAKLRKFKRKRKKKVMKPLEKSPMEDLPKMDIEPLEDHLDVSHPPENETLEIADNTIQEESQTVSLDELADSLNELHDFLCKNSEERNSSVTEILEEHVDENNELQEKELSNLTEDFTTQLDELKDIFTEKICPTDEFISQEEPDLEQENNVPKDCTSSFDKFDVQLDILKELLVPEPDPVETPPSNEEEYETGLEVLQQYFANNMNGHARNSGTDVYQDSPFIVDQRPPEIKELEEALNQYDQNPKLPNAHLEAWEPSYTQIPEIYEEEINLDELVAQGKKHMERKEFVKALSCFDMALELDPQFLDAWSAKGDLMLRISDDEIMIDKLVNEGREHMQKREFQEALGCFDQALELNPKCLDAWSAKGNVLMEIDRGQNY